MKLLYWVKGITLILGAILVWLSGIFLITLAAVFVHITFMIFIAVMVLYSGWELGKYLMERDKEKDHVKSKHGEDHHQPSLH